MTIHLMRHGVPLFARRGWVSPAQMAPWIQSYNRSEVGPQRIPTESQQLVKSTAVLATSTAARSITSAQRLGRRPDLTDPIFCEAALPFAQLDWPPLPPVIWAAFFRVLWFLGYARGAESIHDAKRRAQGAAQKLVALAEQGSVLLLGHGIMNRLIAKELVAMGWRGKLPGGAHWGVASFAPAAC